MSEALAEEGREGPCLNHSVWNPDQSVAFLLAVRVRVCAAAVLLDCDKPERWTPSRQEPCLPQSSAEWMMPLLACFTAGPWASSCNSHKL